jgi:hypothetical protein
MPSLTIDAAAVAMNQKPATVRGWIAHGAPVVRRGARGRGHATLVDPAALDVWRRSDGADRILLEFAARVPALLADVAYDTFLVTSGPHKRASAGSLVAAWYSSTNALLDDLRAHGIDVGEVDRLPDKIVRLRRIFGD